MYAMVDAPCSVHGRIEMSAGLFNQVRPGIAQQMLHNPDRAAHSSDLFFGIDYEIDLSAPSRFRSDGTLIDTAMDLVSSQIPPNTKDDIRKAMQAAFRELTSLGLTSVQLRQGLVDPRVVHLIPREIAERLTVLVAGGDFGGYSAVIFGEGVTVTAPIDEIAVQSYYQDHAGDYRQPPQGLGAVAVAGHRELGAAETAAKPRGRRLKASSRYR